MNMNWQVIIPGAIISAIITTIATILGKLISRSTSIGTANIEDRSKFTRDLLRRVETMEAEVSGMRKRENRIVQIVSIIGGEMRALSGSFDQLINDLEDDSFDRKLGVSQAKTIKANVNRIANRLDVELRSFINDEEIVKIREQETDEATKLVSKPD